ncbi:MAG: formyl-CoA transferase [Candidimonas sp.]|nr:MAG: formyl-CoA transferase [Candidimonas sp.]
MSDTKALEGVRILDMTHVQSGPTSTQLLAWLGADVIKVEMPGRGDVTRVQLRDVPNADSLYFTMLNSNKRSITINMKSPDGKAVIEELLRKCDVIAENFGPGVLDRAGLTWERFQEINPRLIYASIKGFGPGKLLDYKCYEPIAQCMGGSASTTGFEEGPPLVTGSQVGDSGTGVHLALAITAALLQREKTGRGQRVEVAMRDAVLNLCRVKLRDQQRVMRGPMPEYPNKTFSDYTPRSGNASGGGQPGTAMRCKGGGPNDYAYVVIQPQGWKPLMKVVGHEELIDDPAYATPEARIKHLDECFGIVEKWTMTKTKFEVMDILSKFDVPCGPILSTKDLINDKDMYDYGFLVKLDHPTRGEYVQLGCPVRLSDSPVEIKRSPLLGEHTDEILSWLGKKPDEIKKLHAEGAV